ncbi:hypothetical protein [Ornithinimicrobium sp. INDO-MA30-4]|uniref:hypothetical protein n=1 Tax=Ornithinimicrobium sp. INDO-MA30-4 TaxID=2908651 RepID=UPI001F41FA73|nr:hypothetical protein [Ornithinimicrobium sp. INDO-MA30-4]UJH70356.1 hypothetical protein L0A91_14665 [Ornithinimicrobium sp. INDO-MA30-4]
MNRKAGVAFGAIAAIAAFTAVSAAYGGDGWETQTSVELTTYSKYGAPALEDPPMDVVLEFDGDCAVLVGDSITYAALFPKGTTFVERGNERAIRLPSDDKDLMRIDTRQLLFGETVIPDDLNVTDVNNCWDREGDEPAIIVERLDFPTAELYIP